MFVIICSYRQRDRPTIFNREQLKIEKTIIFVIDHEEVYFGQIYSFIFSF